MSDHRPPDLDMLADGTFRTPRRTPLATRVFFWAVLIASIAGAVSLAAFALWVALIILPVALAAGLIAYAAFRFQLWRAGASVGGRPRNVSDTIWRR